MRESKRKLDGEIFLRTQEGINSVAPWETINLREIFLSKTEEERRWLSNGNIWQYRVGKLMLHTELSKNGLESSNKRGAPGS